MNSALRIAALLALAPVCVPAAPLAAQEAATPDASGDGPYVVRDGKQWIARRIGADAKVRTDTIRPAGRIPIAGVGDVPGFVVPLRPPVAAPAAGTVPLDPKKRLLVVADTHGEYEILVAFLRKQGVIDGKLNWRFDKGQMVVTGDMFDRGAHQTEILWLLYKLEAEARRAGGGLHVLLGNHEAMILRGDERYLHPRYPQTAHLLGSPSYGALFGPGSVLGDWLRSRPAVLKLGDLLLLHGGIAPAILDAKADIAELNTGIRTSLATPSAQTSSLDPRIRLIAGSDGPQWYRGYFGKGAAQTSAADIDRTLAAYGVSRILVGHTVVDQVGPRYGGKVIAVQVYPHRNKATGAPVLEGALREDRHWFRVDINGTKEPLTAH